MEIIYTRLLIPALMVICYMDIKKRESILWMVKIMSALLIPVIGQFSQTKCCAACPVNDKLLPTISATSTTKSNHSR